MGARFGLPRKPARTIRSLVALLTDGTATSAVFQFVFFNSVYLYVFM